MGVKGIANKDNLKEGIANKDNLKDWADYTRGNSYIRDKAEARHNLGTDGCDQDIVEGLPPLPRQKDSEGKGYAPIDKVTAKNTLRPTTAGLSAASKEPD